MRTADLDGDSRPEIYLTNYGPDVLYRNRGDGTFEDVTARAGVADARWSTGACFLDHDRDGDLDLYVANYVDFDLEQARQTELREDYHGVRVMYGPRGLRGAPDVFYVNEGEWRFRDSSAEVGIAGPAYFGFNCVTFDVDLDGWPDVYVANDSDPKLLWRNDQHGGFVDVGMRLALALSKAGAAQSSMGACVGDYDGDLRTDVFVTNFSDDYYTLYRAGADAYYSDVSHRARVATPTMPFLGWGCGFADLDADGDEDLYAVNGHVYPQVDRFSFTKGYRQEKLLLENLGDGRFERADGGPGFALPQAGRGSALGDVDGDGDPDLLVEGLDEAPVLLRNDSPGQGRRLVVELVGRGTNRDAVGARVVARCGERRMLRLVGTCSGFLSSDDRRLYLGLGDAARVDELVITWPEGDEERVQDLAAGRSVTIAAGRGVVAERPFEE